MNLIWLETMMRNRGDVRVINRAFESTFADESGYWTRFVSYPTQQRDRDMGYGRFSISCQTDHGRLFRRYYRP